MYKVALLMPKEVSGSYLGQEIKEINNMQLSNVELDKKNDNSIGKLEKLILGLQDNINSLLNKFEQEFNSHLDKVGKQLRMNRQSRIGTNK